MRHRPSLTRIAAHLAVVVLVASCGDDGGGQGDPAGDELAGTVRVFAAASLTDAFGEVVAAFEAANPGVEVELNLAGSSSLREQILAGSPADVFAPADPADLQRLVDAREADEPEPFATNRLQLVVPAGNPGDVEGLDDLADDDLLVGLCAEEVPCGRLARQALARAGVNAAIDTNEPDVRALLTKVAGDELDVGIVYVTDVRSRGAAVEGIDIPAEHAVVATYPIATLTRADNRAGADRFVAFVLSAEAQQILTSYGFGSP